MFTESEGIVLRQTKIAGGRRMIYIFTKKFGKISAGTQLNERGRGKQALAVRPFTYSNFQFFKKGDYININSAETIRSFYHIGEDVDKYMNASYALELTDKLVADDEPAPGLFNLTVDLLSEMEAREKKFETLLLGYEVKALKQVGILPELEICTRCGGEKQPAFFSIKDGGIICGDCLKATNDSLIYPIDFGIIDILKFYLSHPLESLKNLALEDDVAKRTLKMMTEHAKYHLDFGELKSEAFITG